MKHRVVIVLALSVIILSGVFQRQDIHAQTASGVPATRLAHLMRGSNVSEWFLFVDPTQEAAEHFTNYLSDDDMQLMHNLGLTFVRLAIAPGYLYDAQQPGTLKTKVLPFIDKAIDRFLANDLAVIINVHNGLDTDVALLGLETDPNAGTKFAAFWGVLAKHFSGRDPEKVFFEIVNEPQFSDHPEKWVPIQAQVAKAIRSSAPQHTIIAGGTQWSAIDGLIQLKPLDDPNIIYTFHFYESMVFTHQGADWVLPGFEALKGVPYPVDAKLCKAALAATSNDKAKYFLTTYCHDEHWDTAQITARIAVASAWSKQYNVPILLGEFGVYPLNAPADARLRWLTDTRVAVEQAGIGWSVWAYDDDFGLGRTMTNGQLSIDRDAANALGLKADASAATVGQLPPTAQATQAATPSATSDIRSLNDEFEDATTLANWTLNSDVEGYPNQTQTLDINTTSPGNLYIVPYASTWFGDMRGVYLYKQVTGDFIVTERLKVTGKQGDVPTLSYSLAGLLVRAPRNDTPNTWQPGQENWLFIAAGCGDPGSPQIETKTTVNSYSQLTLKPRQLGWINLRIVRLGKLFVMMYQYDGKSWVINQRFSRADLPQTLQVGVHAYTNWDAMPADITYYNKTLLKNASADLIAQVDYVRFLRPQLPADIQQTLASGKNVDDATLLKIVGIDAPQ